MRRTAQEGGRTTAQEGGRTSGARPEARASLRLLHRGRGHQGHQFFHLSLARDRAAVRAGGIRNLLRTLVFPRPRVNRHLLVAFVDDVFLDVVSFGKSRKVIPGLPFFENTFVNEVLDLVFYFGKDGMNLGVISEMSTLFPQVLTVDVCPKFAGPILQSATIMVREHMAKP